MVQRSTDREPKLEGEAGRIDCLISRQLCTASRSNPSGNTKVIFPIPSSPITIGSGKRINTLPLTSRACISTTFQG